MSYKRADKLKARESRFAEPEDIGAVYNEVSSSCDLRDPFLQNDLNRPAEREMRCANA